MSKITRFGRRAGASTLAIATVVSGLSFGPAAVAATTVHDAPSAAPAQWWDPASPLRPVSLPPVPLVRGKATPVAIVARAVLPFSGADEGRVRLELPEGLSFKVGMSRIPGAWSNDGEHWTSYDNHALKDVKYSAGNRVIEASWDEALRLNKGEYNRWLPEVVVDGRTSGAANLGFKVYGGPTLGFTDLMMSGDAAMTVPSGGPLRWVEKPSVELDREKPTAVPIVTQSDVYFAGGPDASVVLWLPEGLSFKKGMTSIPGQWSADGENWKDYGNHSLTDVRYESDRLIAARWKDELTLREGDFNRWLPEVVVDDKDKSGSQNLNFEIDYSFGESRASLKGGVSTTLAAPIPSDDVLQAVPQSPVDLDREKPVAVPLVSKANGVDIVSPSGTSVKLEAPAGTRFKPGMATIPGMASNDGGKTWSGASTRALKDIVYVNERTITANWNQNLEMKAGTLNRWMPELIVDENAGGNDSLAVKWHASGKTGIHSFDVQSSSPVRISDPTLPDAPTIANVTVLSGDSVKVDWNFSGTATKFHVYVNDDVTSIGPGARSLTIENLKANTSYGLQVGAVSPAGEVKSDLQRFVTLKEWTSLPGPFELEKDGGAAELLVGATANLDDLDVKWDWKTRVPTWALNTAIAQGDWITGYTRADSGSEWKADDRLKLKVLRLSRDPYAGHVEIFANVSPSVPMPKGTQVAWGIPVEAKAAVGSKTSVETTFGNNASVKRDVVIVDGQVAPAAPVIVGLEQVGESTDVRVDWNADPEGVESFEVVRSAGGVEETVAKDLPASATSKTIEGHDYGVEYTYTVRAHGATQSTPSEPETVTLQRAAVVSAELPAVDLERGATVPVRVGIAPKGDAVLTGLDGSFEMTAPKGTRFASGQETLAGFVRNGDSGEWVEDGGIALRDVAVSRDGSTLTGTLTASEVSFGGDARWSWTPEVEVLDDAPAGKGELSWTLTAASNYGAQRVEGATGVVVEAENQAPSAPESAEARQAVDAHSDVIVQWLDGVDPEGALAAHRVEEYRDGKKLREAVVDVDGQGWGEYRFEGGHVLGATYEYRIVAIDAKGAESEPATTKLTIEDIESPTWPDGAAIRAENVTEDSFDLVWPSATDNVGVQSYKVYVNEGEPIVVQPAAGGTQGVHVSGLQAGTTYNLRVVASDGRQDSTSLTGQVATTGR